MSIRSQATLPRVKRGSDRRRYARTDVEFGSSGVTTSNVPIRIVNVSATGLLVHAQGPLIPGTIEMCRFVEPEGRSTDLPVRVQHASPTDSFFRNSYLVGLEFRPRGTRDTAAIDRLIRGQLRAAAS